LTAGANVHSQNTIILFEYDNFLQKIKLILYPSLGNLTTQIIIGNRGNQANSQASNDKTATSGSGGRIRRRSAPPVTLEGIF
jgi:hypothetical protein